VLKTRAPDADGEGVWSWHPDAGVKFAGVIPQATVAKEPVHRLSDAHISERVVRRTGKRESFQCSRTPFASNAFSSEGHLSD
jgi:hypothetical protein